jgi:hypothetical protein
MSFLSTAKGTEIAFELRDSELRERGFAAPTDRRWLQGTEVRLRDAHGALIAENPPGSGRLSIGQHAFGFLGRDLVFDPLAPGMERVTLELRGGLGDWDVPLELTPISQTDVIPAIPVDAEQERRGVRIRVRALALTESGTYMEVEMTATSPPGSVRQIGSFRMEEHRFAFVDEHGGRFEELIARDLPRANALEGGRTVASFAPLPSAAKEITLVVPALTVQESEGSLQIALPVHAPTDLSFGPYPMTVRWADIVEDLRPAPGDPPARGVEVQFRRGGWRDDRQARWPGRVLVDGTRTWNFGMNNADPESPVVNINLAGASAETVTFLEPIVKVRGPWEIRVPLPE